MSPTQISLDLKQANNQWYAKLSSFLFLYGFKQAIAYHSLFLKLTDSSSITLLVYVDDIASNNIT